MHEQSETVERDGKFFNVYGAATPGAGKVLPGEPAYNTLKEAVTAAKNRSERHGQEHRGNNMSAPSQSDDAKAARYRQEAKDPGTMPSEEDLQNYRDEQERLKAEKASSTYKNMGEGKIPSVPEVVKKGIGYVKDKLLGKSEGRKHGGSIKKYASGGSIRGGGIEQRGKTKGRMV